MKKRLRKKLGLGEFRELCFDVNCTIGELSEEAEDALFDQVIAVLEKHDMYCYGCLEDRKLELVVSTGLVDTDNESRYEAAKQDLAAVSGLNDLEVSGLI